MKEIGGHSVPKNPYQWRPIQKINHPSEVNKARYMPQNPNIIGTMAGVEKENGPGRVFVFDRTKHETEPRDEEVRFELELEGHKAEGWAMSWNWDAEGELVTGAGDSTVKVWDCKSNFSKSKKTIAPVHEWNFNTASVNDVQHHPKHPFWIGTVSDDKSLQVIDTRIQRPRFKLDNAHDDAINCIAFHPKHDVLLATASQDANIAMWDLRLLKKAVHTFQRHRDSVVKLEWSPTHAHILGSASADRRVILWNIADVGAEQTEEEAEEGPPELYVLSVSPLINSTNALAVISCTAVSQIV